MANQADHTPLPARFHLLALNPFGRRFTIWPWRRRSQLQALPERIKILTGILAALRHPHVVRLPTIWTSTRPYFYRRPQDQIRPRYAGSRAPLQHLARRGNFPSEQVPHTPPRGPEAA